MISIDFQCNIVAKPAFYVNAKRRFHHNPSRLRVSRVVTKARLLGNRDLWI
jgi:hypothetical protein